MTTEELPSLFVSKAQKQKWPRAAAIEVAREICQALTPACERIIVAGSLRRKKPIVGDVEILFIPKMEERQADLISTEMVSLADEIIQRLLDSGTIQKRLSVTGTTSWGRLNKLAVHRSGIPIDFFQTTQEAWFNYLVCRTGPANSNTQICMAAQDRGWKWNPYGSGFSKDGETVAMNSEQAVFGFVGLPYFTPEERN